MKKGLTNEKRASQDFNDFSAGIMRVVAIRRKASRRDVPNVTNTRWMDTRGGGGTGGAGGLGGGQI